MALKLEDLRPQDRWDRETTWEELGESMNPPMPQAWIRGLKKTDPDIATSYASPTPADFWHKYWNPARQNDWNAMRSCLWVSLHYMTYGDLECHYGKEGNISHTSDLRIDQILALLAGLDANTDLNSTPMFTVNSPFNRTRNEQRLETLDYTTTQANWDLETLRERLHSVKHRMTILEKKAERKRYQQEKGR